MEPEKNVMVSADALRKIYEELYESGVYDVTLEAVSILSKFESFGFDADKCLRYMLDEIEHYEKTKDDLWQDVRVEKKVEKIKAFHRILCSPLEDMPLMIHDPFGEIASWRLKNGI